MRVSEDRAEKVKARAAAEDRTQVAELDRIIDAGITALDSPKRNGTKPKGR